MGGFRRSCSACCPDQAPRTSHPRRSTPRPHGAPAALVRARFPPAVREVLETLFDEEVLAAQSMFYFKPPGARGQALHQDNFYLRVEPGTCVAAWVACDVIDRDNGGLEVVPGTHRMDLFCPEEADAEVSVDLGGRPYLVFEAKFARDRVGDLPTELVPHFFRSLAETLGAAIHVRVRGENTHHMVEVSFKALARALRQAFKRQGDELPTTKGRL